MDDLVKRMNEAYTQASRDVNRSGVVDWQSSPEKCMKAVLGCVLDDIREFVNEHGYWDENEFLDAYDKN